MPALEKQRVVREPQDVPVLLKQMVSELEDVPVLLKQRVVREPQDVPVLEKQRVVREALVTALGGRSSIKQWFGRLHPEQNTSVPTVEATTTKILVLPPCDSGASVVSQIISMILTATLVVAVLF